MRRPLRHRSSSLSVGARHAWLGLLGREASCPGVGHARSWAPAAAVCRDLCTRPSQLAAARRSARADWIRAAGGASACSRRGLPPPCVAWTLVGCRHRRRLHSTNLVPRSPSTRHRTWSGWLCNRGLGFWPEFKRMRPRLRARIRARGRSAAGRFVWRKAMQATNRFCKHAGRQPPQRPAASSTRAPPSAAASSPSPLRRCCSPSVPSKEAPG